MAQKLSRTRELAARVIFAALEILKEKGGEAPGDSLGAGGRPFPPLASRPPIQGWSSNPTRRSDFRVLAPKLC